MMPPDPFSMEISRHIWKTRYRAAGEADIQATWQRVAHAIRNSHLLVIGPAGTISLLANNCSSGIEPIFAAEAEWRVLGMGGRYRSHRVIDPALHRWQQQGHAGTPPALVEAQQIDPLAHLEMQAALQSFVDNAISKTINVAADIPFERFENIYRQAARPQGLHRVPPQPRHRRHPEPAARA